MTINRIAWALAASLGLLTYGVGQEATEPAQDPPRPVKKRTELKFLRVKFTFVRIQYSSTGGLRRAGARDSRWATDYPDSDINLTARVAEDVGLRTDPKGMVLRLTDRELNEYPFLYLTEPGSLEFSEDEVRCLRTYLLEGGFLMVDDFWGADEWANFHRQFQRVFPDRPLKEIPIEHPLFHCYYDLKSKPQVPSIHGFLRGTPEGGAEYPPHYWGLSDDQGRLMAVVCHNTDLGDGWERAEEDPRYFREISQRLAYPMGVNIVVYALTDRSADKLPQAKPVD